MSDLSRDMLDHATADAAVMAIPAWLIRPAYGRADLIKRADASSMVCVWGGLGLYDTGSVAAWIIALGFALCAACRGIEIVGLWRQTKGASA